MGSRIYISPENYRKKEYSCTANDMYALGVLAFVLCTGHYPDNESKIFRHFHSLNSDGSIWKKVEKGITISASLKKFIESLLLPQSL